MWLSELTGDEDEAYLADGLTNGFSLLRQTQSMLRLIWITTLSATNPVTKPLVEQTILAEIQEGNYVVTPTSPTVVSALGAIPKKDSSEIQLIHDCSCPHGQALDDYISIDSFKYQSLDAALALLWPNYFMAKIDLRHAYRSVPIHPCNYKATGCKWQFSGSDSFTYFYDACLPFGARAAPIIFQHLTQAVHHMMAKWGFHDVVVYLDDFLVIMVV